MDTLHRDVLLQIFRAVELNESPRFMHVEKLDFDARKVLGMPAETRNQRLGWVRLGHINHVWRVALLDAQSLWADHIGSLPAGVDEMFARAGPTAPLTLHLPLWMPGMSLVIRDFVRLLRKNGMLIRPRLKAIAVWDPCPVKDNASPAVRQNIPISIERELPAFTRSMMAIWNHNNDNLFPFFLLNSTLLTGELATLENLDLSRHNSSENVITVNAPNLRHLRIQNCPFSCPQSTQLTTISITRIMHRQHRWNPWPNRSMDHILDLLQQCATTLKHIELNDLLSSEDQHSLFATEAILAHGFLPSPHLETSLSRPRRLGLPALKSITLQDRFEVMVHLLDCLQFPQDTITYLKPQHNMFLLNQDEEPDPSFRAALAKYPDCRSVGLVFRDDSAPRGSIDVYSLSDESVKGAHSCVRYLTRMPIIKMSADLSPNRARSSDVVTIAKTITSELFVSGVAVEELAISLRNWSSQDKVLDILKCAPHARHVCIETQSRTFMAIAYALRRYIAENTSRQLYQSICLVAGAEPTAVTSLAQMSIAFGQPQACIDTTVLHVDEEFEKMPGGEKAQGYLEELGGVFRKVVMCNCTM